MLIDILELSQFCNEGLSEHLRKDCTNALKHLQKGIISFDSNQKCLPCVNSFSLHNVCLSLVHLYGISLNPFMGLFCGF